MNKSIDYHPLLKDIYYLHCEIYLIKEQIRNIIEKLFINENIFPNDQFIGQLAKILFKFMNNFHKLIFLKKKKVIELTYNN